MAGGARREGAGRGAAGGGGGGRLGGGAGAGLGAGEAGDEAGVAIARAGDGVRCGGSDGGALREATAAPGPASRVGAVGGLATRELRGRARFLLAQILLLYALVLVRAFRFHTAATL